MHEAHKVLLQLKQISLCFIWCHGRFRKLLFLSKNLEKNIFVMWLAKYKKNFAKYIQKLLQHLQEKFIGNNLSISL